MLTKVIEQAKIDHFTKWFERADKIVIVSHVSPDGDAIGSSLGLYHFFDSQEKTVNVSFPMLSPISFGGCRAAKTFSCTTVTKNLRIS